MTRCKACGGTGKIMGGGFMQHPCVECDGKGKKEVIDLVAARKTDSYKKAKKRMQAKHKDLSDADAENILDKELQTRL